MADANSSMPGQGHSNRRARVWLAVIVVVLAASGVAVLVWPTVRVPDLALAQRERAEALLDDAQLRVGAVGEVATATAAYGVVVEQSPAAGATARKRSSVDITVTAQSVVVAVPDVVGMEASAAQKTLEDMVLQVASVDVLDTAEGAAVGTVIAQMPAAGTAWYAGQPVAIAIAAGPDDGTGTTVPDVTGSSFDFAVEALSESGLLGYAITDDPANLDRPDVDVLEQLPAEGVMIRQGTTVLLKLGQ